MTQSPTERAWSEVLAHEAAGRQEAARACCEAILRIDHRHAPAHLRLSHYAQARGSYRRARQHALDAGDALRRGASARHLPRVTLRLLDFAEHAEIGSLVLSADWANPHVLAASAVLAQHLWLAGRYDDAWRFIDAVDGTLGTPHPLLLFTRGNLLRFAGNLEGARACFEAAIQDRPGLADAHFALATLGVADGADARAQRIGRVLGHMPQEDRLSRATLHYARFHELDALDRVEPAWVSLEAGMRLMHESAAGAHRSLERLEALVSERAWEAGPPARPVQADVQPRPVFVAGLPRTGTTLLDRMLGNHGWITSVGESNDLRAAVSEVGDLFYPGLPMQGARLLEDIDLAAVGRAYLERLRLAAPATALAVDKNPRNLFEIPLILAALPSARIVVLRREPRDAVFSLLKALFPGGGYGYSYDASLASRQVAIAEAWIQRWATLRPDAVRVVPYESLARDPEPALLELQAFLGIPVQPGLSDIARNTAPVSTLSSAQVRAEVHDRAVGAWKRYAQPLSALHPMFGPGAAHG